jgi:cytochrome c553
MFVTSLVAITPSVAETPLVPVDQGSDWTADKRDRFYSLDQGSRIMPLDWIRALKLPDGSPFMKDSLRRYGFLPNDASGDNLPVGFTTGGPGKFIGLTCAACHTRQIEYSGNTYRIDGGPALIDFQMLVSDLDNAVGGVLNSSRTFSDFANSVLPSPHTSADKAALRQALSIWYHRYHTLIHKALPPIPWGPGRLDAIGMIFNRLAGLDLGRQSVSVIEENIKRADAPVRYPFLWNAAKQDKTQWLGFQRNDNIFLALGRNIGQVFGVFAEFHPEVYAASGDIDYVIHNSANFKNLIELEELMKNIDRPVWPWAIDNILADKGEKIFNRHTNAGGCVDCHGEKDNGEYWMTPIIPVDEVKTDYRQTRLLDLNGRTGILEGTAVILDEDKYFSKYDRLLGLLEWAVKGTFRDVLARGGGGSALGLKTTLDTTKILADLKGMYDLAVKGYEARVLHGIWAAAPYLHNGSVPTLTELLKPPDKRIPSFKIGPAYDPIAVGLAVEQPHAATILKTTDCRDRGSGNSRCGHEYGTTLSDLDKRALLEYLKRL